MPSHSSLLIILILSSTLASLGRKGNGLRAVKSRLWDSRIRMATPLPPQIAELREIH